MPSTNNPLPMIHILYENPAWLPPLEEALEAQGFTCRRVLLEDSIVDPTEEPPAGIWVNRISPSSHTRGHEASVGMARDFIQWLESWGRRVINGSDAYESEMSKLRQDLLLRRHGILSPRTLLAAGRPALVRAAASFDGPFITKHNRGGKGLGIQLFGSPEQLAAAIDAGTLDPSPNGQFILQEYIASPEPFITRVELVGGEFVFAMRSSTADGFELCPSDACQTEAAVQAAGPDVCPIDSVDAGAKFSSSPISADDPLVRKYAALCIAEGIDVAGIEFVEDVDGVRYTYDINGTTNYNAAFGATIDVNGMEAVARWMKDVVVPQEWSRGDVSAIKSRQRTAC